MAQEVQIKKSWLGQAAVNSSKIRLTQKKCLPLCVPSVLFDQDSVTGLDVIRGPVGVVLRADYCLHASRRQRPWDTGSQEFQFQRALS